MASGYENSPEYGGPDVVWPKLILGVLAFALICGAVLYFR